MTKRIYEADDLNHAVLTVGTMADWSIVYTSLPRRQTELRTLPADLYSRETVIAHAFCNRYRAAALAYARRGDATSAEAALKLDAHTWVLGPATKGRGIFSSWFDSASPETRVVVHRAPWYGLGRRVAGVWGTTYRGQTVPLKMPEQHLTPEQILQGAWFLRRVLQAYRDGKPGVEAMLRESGHPYWFSDGRPGNP